MPSRRLLVAALVLAITVAVGVFLLRRDAAPHFPEDARGAPARSREIADSRSATPASSPSTVAGSASREEVPPDTRAEDASDPVERFLGLSEDEKAAYLESLANSADPRAAYEELLLLYQACPEIGLWRAQSHLRTLFQQDWDAMTRLACDDIVQLEDPVLQELVSLSLMYASHTLDRDIEPLVAAVGHVVRRAEPHLGQSLLVNILALPGREAEVLPLLEEQLLADRIELTLLGEILPAFLKRLDPPPDDELPLYRILAAKVDHKLDCRRLISLYTRAGNAAGLRVLEQELPPHLVDLAPEIQAALSKSP